MRLSLVRKIKTDNSTIGELAINGIFFGYTLELPWRNNHRSESCIPVGTYFVRVIWSEHFKRFVGSLEDVPGRDAIEIHVGNYPHDTHGCILVGYSKDVDFVGNSKLALDLLIEKIKDAFGVAEDVTIEIKEG